MVLFVLKACVLLLMVSSATSGDPEDRCPMNWSYFPNTNKCFRVFGGDKDGVKPTTWLLAEEYCQLFNEGHLGSFHSEEEITFVIDLAHKANLHGDRMFVGLSFNSLTQWSWLDGSSATYFRWWDGPKAEENSVTNPAGVLFTRKMHAGYMWVTNGQVPHSFACQATAETETTLKHESIVQNVTQIVLVEHTQMQNNTSHENIFSVSDNTTETNSTIF